MRVCERLSIHWHNNMVFPLYDQFEARMEGDLVTSISLHLRQPLVDLMFEPMYGDLGIHLADGMGCAW